MRDLSSLTGDQTCAPCGEGTVLTTGLPRDSQSSFVFVIGFLNLLRGELPAFLLPTYGKIKK